MTTTGKRAIHFILIVLVIISGLASRKYNEFLPSFIAEYSGDTLWALMIFLIARFIFPSYSIRQTAAAALVFCFIIELSQLYQADWINSIRQTKIGGLILGFGFLWSDLICYTVGVAIGVILEKAMFVKCLYK